MFKKVCIIGCGLIGSSIARGIKKNKLATKVVSSNRSNSTNKKVIKLKIVNEASSDTKKIFNALKEYKIKSNKPSANFFLINFDKMKIDSDKAFEELANKRLILRKMTQYKMPSALRITIGNEEANNHFIKSLGSLFK